MKRKLARIAVLSKKAGRFAKAKIKNRDFRNFYAGKSLGHLTKKTLEYLVKEGPVGLARQTRRFLEYGGLNAEPGAGITFPNGVKGYYDKKEIKAWFKGGGKKALIVIPSYNDMEILSKCVDSLRAYTPKGMLEVIIIDDYCQPENLAKLKTLEGPDLKILPRKENGGYARAVNDGLKVALKRKMDAIIVTSDIVAKAGWYEALQFGAYNYHKDVGIVGPKLLYPDGRIQSSGSFRNPHATEWFDHYYRFREEDYGPANIPQYCLGVTGAVTYIKFPVLRDVGILGDYPFAFEDMDYAVRAWEKGYRSLYFPDSVLYHIESASRKKNPTISEREKASVVKFWSTWGKWFDERNVKNAKGEIRVIYVLQTAGFSGGIKVVVEHVNRLKKLGGFAPEVWSLDQKEPAWPLLVPHKSFTTWDKLTEALAKEEAIKVATWWETAQPVWLGSVIKGIPVYFIQEIETWFYPDNPRAQHAVVSCYRHEFRNLTTSIYNEQELKSLQVVVNGRVTVGVDRDIYKPGKQLREPDVLLTNGRRFFQKNFKFLLNAWEEMGDKRPRMWLYGQDKDLAKIDPKKISYFVSPSEHEVADLHRKATCFVLTSYHEGFAMPPLEAMSCGTSVITTDCHGNRDYTRDGENCIVVPQDDVPALKKALERVLTDAKLRDKLSHGALKTAKEFDWNKLVIKLADFYNGVAAQPNASYIKREVKKYK